MEFRARQTAGDVSMNMARMSGNGYDNSLIGPDDLLEVSVFTGRDDEKTRPLAVRVGKDGSVGVSPIGNVHVGGLDPVDAADLIATAAIERGIYVQPNVTVEFKKKAVNHITVLGAVQKPGLIEVPRNSSDVVSAIAMAGGVTEEAGSDVEIIRQNIPVESNYTRFAEQDVPSTKNSESSIELAAYSTLSSTPNTSGSQSSSHPQGKPVTQRINLAHVTTHSSHQDYQLGDRDVVMVQPRPKRTIHVAGLVKKPGQFELSQTEDIRLLDAIAMAGGSASIVADKVLIVRPIAGRQPIVIQASMQRAKHDGQENLVLTEGDMVSIEQTPATAALDSLSRVIRLTVGVSGNNIF
jgi:polysaccharide export outer membrane protein